MLEPSFLMTAAKVSTKVVPKTAHVLNQSVAPVVSRTTGLNLTLTRVLLLAGATYVGYRVARALADAQR